MEMDTIDQIRDEVSKYLPQANERFLFMVYTMMIEQRKDEFSDEQLRVLHERRDRQISGESKGYTRSEARERMRQLKNR
jgi:hypothetical protein